jgi:hypothetical protein
MRKGARMNGTILITARAAQALSLKDEARLGDWLVSVVDPKDPKIVTAKADVAARQGRFLVLVVYIPSAAGKSAEEASALGNQVRKAISDLQEIAQKAAARAKSKQDHVPVCGVVDSFDPTAIPLGVGDIPLVSSADKLTEWLHGLAHFLPRTSERTVRIIGTDSGQEATAPQQKSPARPRVAKKEEGKPDKERGKQEEKGPEGKEDGKAVIPRIRLATRGSHEPKPAVQKPWPGPILQSPRSFRPFPTEIDEAAWAVWAVLGAAGAYFVWWLVAGGGARSVALFLKTLLGG